MHSVLCEERRIKMLTSKTRLLQPCGEATKEEVEARRLWAALTAVTLYKRKMLDNISSSRHVST